jgi:hypothetical protein
MPRLLVASPRVRPSARSFCFFLFESISTERALLLLTLVPSELGPIWGGGVAARKASMLQLKTPGDCQEKVYEVLNP